MKSLKVVLITYASENPTEAITNTSIPLNFRPTTLWRRKQTTNALWREAKITYSTAEQHSIVFSATPDPSFSKYRGFVAVDDITFRSGPCDSKYLDAPLGLSGYGRQVDGGMVLSVKVEFSFNQLYVKCNNKITKKI